jgi:hypothetical protein
MRELIINVSEEEMDLKKSIEVIIHIQSPTRVIRNYHLNFVKEGVTERTDIKKCPNQDENGNCPLNNLQCNYPDCEKVKE